MKLILNLLNSGLADLADRTSLIKRVKLVNLLSLVSASFALFSLPFDAYQAPRWMMVEDGVCAVFFAMIPWMNRLGWYRFSRIGFILFANALFLIDAALLESSYGLTLFFFALASFGVILLESSEKFWLVISTTMPIVSYFVLVQLQSPPPGPYALYTAGANFLFICGGIYFLSRTSDGFEEELKRTREAAIRAEKLAALGEMSSGIAHEINNPLTILHLHLKLLNRKLSAEATSNPEIRDHLDKMQKMIARTSGITRAMLGFSKNSQLADPAPTQMRILIEDTLELCRDRFLASKVELAVQTSDHDLVIHCRAIEISHVILNLLNNSLQAVENLPEKWVRLQIFTDDSFVRIAVIDSGRRIPDHLHAKIFEPFFTTKGPGKGTGLGLSVSKGIIENHQGRIFVAPENPNTEFVVELPR